MNPVPLPFDLLSLCSALRDSEYQWVTMDSPLALLRSRTPLSSSVFIEKVKRIHALVLGYCRAVADRQAALRQLTSALHLNMTGVTATANSGRDPVIRSYEDKIVVSPAPREDNPLHILYIHTWNLNTYTNTHIYSDSNPKCSNYLWKKSGHT